MAIRVGAIAEGEDFFDRVTELDDLWRYVEGNHILLSGPRRLGKSSLLKRFAEQATAQGILARLVDVEGIDNAGAFVAELVRAFPDESLSGYASSAGTALGSLLTRFRKMDLRLPGGWGGGLEIQALPDVPWREQALGLQHRLSELPAFLLVDEFSVFLEKLTARSLPETQQLLGWLRAWRQQSGVACRFILSGSISVIPLLARYRLNTTVNDCHEYKLGPFRLGAARQMLSELAQREKWQLDNAVAEHLCNRIGWLSPFYLSLFLATTIEAARDRLLETENNIRLLTMTDAEDAWDRLLASRSRFMHWFQRLQRDLSEPQLSFALATLRTVARAENVLTQAQLLSRLARLEIDPDRRVYRLSEVLLLLEEDGYIGIEGEGRTSRIRFLSFLLRDYWRRNHGQ